MTAREYLEPLRTIDILINSKLREIEYLNGLLRRREDIIDQATHTTIDTSKDYIKGDPSHSKTEDGGIRLAATNADVINEKVNKYNADINAYIDLLVDYKREATSIIAAMKFPKQRQVLELRYVNNLQWPTIADIMRYEISWVHRLHGASLAALDVVMSKRSNEKQLVFPLFRDIIVT